MSWTRRQVLGAILATPWLARAADGNVRVSVLATSTESAFRSRADALRKALAGSAATLDFHYADGHMERLPAMAQAIAAAAPAVVVASSAITARALKEATATVPIVMANADEPVADRLVRSAQQPGGNVTGLFTGRRDDLIQATRYLAAVVPKDRALAGLCNQVNVNYRPARARLHYAGQQEKRTMEYLDASSPAEIDRAFEALAAQRIGGVVVMADPLYLDERERLVRAAARARVPVMYSDRAFVRAGGLMAYGGDSDADMARAAGFVRRILDGAHPADLPLEMEPPFKFTLNASTARALKLTLPPDLQKAARGA
jgi:putative ABC transport system substrate-binding protein